MDQIPNGSAEVSPGLTADADEGDATQTIRGNGWASPAAADDPAMPPTMTVGGAAPHPVTDVVRLGPGLPAAPAAKPAREERELARPHGAGQPPELVRYGPGVPGNPPAGRPALTAEHVWRASDVVKPPPRRPAWRRLLGLALTVILLAASCVLVYQRFLHHAPMQVTGVAITQQARNGCGVVVTGRITTNGSAGTVSYQWLFEPSQQPPQPLSQSVLAGQQAAFVTVSIEGDGHGSASQTVILQVLGPDTRTASAVVALSCL